MASIYTDYVLRDPALMPFYARDPKALLQEVPVSPALPPGLREALTRYQTALGHAKEAPENAAYIITGQQPAFFLGPFYVLYKALTAIKLARSVEERTGTPCVPLFWVGSDDHDLEEARNAHVLSKHYEKHSFRYTPPTEAEGRPLHQMPVTKELHGFVDRFATLAPGSEFSPGIAGMLHQTLDASDSLADWAARILAWLFHDTPLLLFSPHLAESRRLAAPLIAHAISDPLECSRLLNEAGAQLRDLGYAAQVEKRPDECAFFLDVDGYRRKVAFRNGLFLLPEIDHRHTPDELLAILDAHPERFSPNVALRCVVQQALFPGTAAYVAGPGEIAYWAQLKPVFAAFKQPMPVVYPRASALITTTKLRQLMGRYGLGLEDLILPEQQIIERALLRVGNNPAIDMVSLHRAVLDKALKNFLEDVRAAGGKDQQPGDLAASFVSQVGNGLDRIERLLLRQDETQVEAVRQQVMRLRDALAPERKPQERVYSSLSFLFAQGDELIPRLLERIDITSFKPSIVEL